MNILDIDARKKVIAEIKGDENVQRKIVSFKKMRMQQDNFKQYVTEYLEDKFDPQTVKEMKVFGSVNLQKRVSKAEASIYRNEPERMFFNGEDKIEELGDIYKDMNINNVLKRANVAYKYQDQCAIQVYPESGCLKARVLLPHHYDVIPNEMNPELGDTYIISNFDNTMRDRVRDDNNRTGYSQGDKYRDGVNQAIGDFDDSDLKNERFFFYNKDYHFCTNGKGEILDKQTFEVITEDIDVNDINIVSPLKEYGINSFIDVADAKDFEFWVNSGDVLYDTTVLYNVILTSEYNTVEMQGRAQAFYKGDAEHMPENLRVGVNHVIFLPVDPNNQVNSEFGFANPGSDLSGTRDFRESFVKSFLTSRGLDASIISGESSTQSASSGVEKMLQMIEKFEASQDDLSLFEKIEIQLCKIVTSWVLALKNIRVDGAPVLEDKYDIPAMDIDSLTCNVEFGKPELVKTEIEQLNILDKELELGVTSVVHYLMEHKGFNESQAIEYVQQINKYEELVQPIMQVEQPIEEVDDGSTEI